MWRNIEKLSNRWINKRAPLSTPTQNSYVERFNRTYRDEVLNMYVFKTLNEVRELTENWIRQYNEERPHDSMNDLTGSIWTFIKNWKTLIIYATKKGMFTQTNGICKRFHKTILSEFYQITFRKKLYTNME